MANEWTVRETITVAAPVATVWDLVSDIGLPARFSDEFRGAEWLDEGRAVGARFRGTNHHPRTGTWTTISTVTSYEPPTSFGWTVGSLENPTAHWRFDLDDSGEATLVTMTARLGTGPSLLTPLIESSDDGGRRILERRMGMWRSNMRSTLDGLRHLAEDTPSQSGD